MLREGSSDPVLLCIQISPTDQNGAIIVGEELRLEITSVPGSADGIGTLIHVYLLCWEASIVHTQLIFAFWP